MNRFDEVNWSGFIRKCIKKKTEELSWKEEILERLEREKEIIKWSVDLQKKSRKGRSTTLKKKGLL